MKKFLIITVLFMMIFTIPVLAGFSRVNGTCAMKGCNNAAAGGRTIYCSKHKCIWSGCISGKTEGSSYCAYHNNKNNRKSTRKSSSGRSYSSGAYKSLNGSSTRKKSSRSSKSIFDPDDHDIEAYYDDHRDEYDDYDDAYEGFMDDESAWDDY